MKRSRESCEAEWRKSERASSCSASPEETWITRSFSVDPVVRTTNEWFCPFCFTSQMISPVFIHPPSSEKQKQGCLACRECVENVFKLYDRSEKCFDCPLCDEVVNTEGLNSLVESTAKNLVESLNIGRHPKRKRSVVAPDEGVCGVCEHSEAKTYCMQCNFALCSKCKEEMHSKKCFQHHTLVPVKDALVSSPISCPLHPSHQLDLFCFDCQKTGCVKCCFSELHENHHFSPVCDVAATMLRDVKEAISKTKSNASTSSLRKNELRECTLGVEAAANSQKKAISAMFLELKNILSCRENFLIGQIEAGVLPTLSMLQEFAKQCDAIENQSLKETKNWANLENENPLTLAQAFQPFQRQAENSARISAEVLSSLRSTIDSLKAKIENCSVLDNLVGTFRMCEGLNNTQSLQLLKEELNLLGNFYSSLNADAPKSISKEKSVFQSSSSVEPKLLSLRVGISAEKTIADSSISKTAEYAHSTVPLTYPSSTPSHVSGYVLPNTQIPQPTLEIAQINADDNKSPADAPKGILSSCGINTIGITGKKASTSENVFGQQQLEGLENVFQE